MSVNVSVNPSVLKVNVSKQSSDIESKPQAEKPKHLAEESTNFRDTLESIKRAAADERAHAQQVKIQKNREAKSDAAQKAAEQKSKASSRVTESKPKCNEPTASTTKAQKSPTVSSSKSGDAKPSQALEGNQESSLSNKGVGDSTDEVDSQDVEKNTFSTAECAPTNIDDQNDIDATDLAIVELAQAADSRELAKSVQVVLKGQQSFGAEETMLDKNIDLSNENGLTKLIEKSEQGLSSIQHSSITLNSSESSEAAEPEKLHSTDSQKHSTDISQTLVIDANSQQNVDVLQALNSSQISVFQVGAEESTETAIAPQSEGNVPLEALTSMGAFKASNTLATMGAEKTTATTTDSNTGFDGNVDSFKSILGEVKLASGSGEKQLDESSTEPKTIADQNKVFSQSFTQSLTQNFSSSEASTRGFLVRTQVAVPVGQPQWSQAVGDKVLWLAAQNVTSAELHLHPEDLGPMQVRVSVGQDQTTQVSFTSHHAQVRELLDQNMQRLKDMFAEQGMHSVQVDVSDRSSHRQAQEQHPKFNHNQNRNTDEEVVAAVSSIQIKRLVDHYA